MCLLLEYLLYRCVLAEGKCLFGNNIVFLGFDSWILLKAFRLKVMAKHLLFCCAGTVSPTRVHADLLDGIAFEALSLVVCAKGPMYSSGQ